ncbi:hypothetical protein TWF694_000193 [Orbilia ellipsospora]|uniref:Actin-like ATPase domain-containing protein n=1 Tax=Orbilia ellipsospora TaxID=2528407 RepID=A0AAV9XPA1_9PEZI
MERESLIVAVDFGTTYSGVAFCHSHQQELNDIEVITSWAGNGIAPKVPTDIRYLPLREPLWGAEASLAYGRRQASNSSIVYSRFKLLLDLGGGSSTYGKTPQLQQNDDCIVLPRNKSAVNVCTDYLRCLYSCLMEMHLRKRLPDTLEVTPIRFIFTVPAIWDHKAQEMTRYAAIKAGFGSRDGDRLSLVSEPEAAAMFVIQAMHDRSFRGTAIQSVSSIKINEAFVICDAGGGTVDLISYRVERLTPKLALKEAVVGTGGKCGSSYIDEAFISLLRQRVGADEFDDETKWTQKDIGRGSTLMETFDSIKKGFGLSTTEQWYIKLPVPVDDNEEEGILDNELELTKADMESLFEPVVKDIIYLVEQQVKVVRAKKEVQHFSKIFLVGGFGESQYLFRRLDEWARSQTPPLFVVNPPKSWSAIVRGAVLQALQPVVRSRHLRQHYGFACNQEFDPVHHRGAKTFKCIWSGDIYAENTIMWTGAMGDECAEDGEGISMNVFRDITEYTDLSVPYRITLYGSTTSIAPTYSHQAYVLGYIEADFSSVDTSTLQQTVEMEDNQAVEFFKLRYTVKMKLNSADVTFSIWLHDVKIGETRIAHDG